MSCYRKKWKMSIMIAAPVWLLYGLTSWKWLLTSPAAYSENGKSIQRDDGKKNTQTVFAFVRIQKTGSTSMLSFLKRTVPSWHKFLTNASAVKDPNLPFCIYGKKGATLATGKIDNFQNNTHDASFQCSHYKADQLRSRWTGSLKHAVPRNNYSLQLFTMVREPYERLRSMFYYVQKYCNVGDHWQGMFTQEQYARICNTDDFEGWLGLLRMQGLRYSGVKQQFYYFGGNNISAAMAQVVGGQPDVIPLVQECFDDSLRLLQKLLEFPEEAIEDFCRQPKLNYNGNMYNSTMDRDGRLRRMAQMWFHEDYEFYRACLKQFRRQLEVTGVKATCKVLPDV